MEMAVKKGASAAAKIEYHHITPKYLGGDAKGPTVPLNAAYHQLITNAFRDLHKYGQQKPTQAELEIIMKKVYDAYPLPG
jgi:hypothetical protein